MSPKRRERRTVLEFGVARGGGGVRGFRKARKALTFAVCWSMCETELQRPPTIDEYGEWWKISRATAYREWQQWRDLFGVWWDTPSELLDALGIERAERSGVNVGSLIAPEVDPVR